MNECIAIDSKIKHGFASNGSSPDPATSEEFYHLLEQVPESEAMWAERQATLRGWRTEPRFQPYWRVIDQMLTVDFVSFRRWADLAEAVNHLEGYDYDAWRRNEIMI